MVKGNAAAHIYTAYPIAFISSTYFNYSTLEDLNVPEKIRLGLLGKDTVQSVTQDGRFILASAQVEGSVGPLALRLQKTDTNERYYLEYRKDSVHTVPELFLSIWDEKKNSHTKQVIIPFDESHFSWYDGYEFYDKVNGIRIKKLSGDDKNTQLQVTFDKK